MSQFAYKGETCTPDIWLRTCLSYENGYSPRCNLTHNRVTHLIMPLFDVENSTKSCTTFFRILNTLPNGVTHYNYTWIVVFPMFIFVEYQLFTISFFIKTMPKKIMDFEHPTKLGNLCSYAALRGNINSH